MKKNKDYCVALMSMMLLLLAPRTMVVSQSSEKSITLEQILVLDEPNNFINVGQIACDSNRNIYVTDDYLYTIKEFDSLGILNREYGKHGNHKGEFLSYPFRIIDMGNILAVAEIGSPRLQFFTTDWKFVGERLVGGVVVDIAFRKPEVIVVSQIPFSHLKKDIVLEYNVTGSESSSVILQNLRGQYTMQDMAMLAVNKRNNLIVAYGYVNNIVVYDEHNHLISDFSINDFPQRSTTIQSKFQEIGDIPQGKVIGCITTDPAGNIFVLSGDYGEKPGQTVYVCSERGEQLAKFVLPEKTGLIYVDGPGYLFTREKQRTIIKKYKLDYHNF